MTIEKLERANELEYRIRRLRRNYQELKLIKDKGCRAKSINIGHSSGATGDMRFDEDDDIISGIVDLMIRNSEYRINELEGEFKSL